MPIKIVDAQVHLWGANTPDARPFPAAAYASGSTGRCRHEDPCLHFRQAQESV